MLVQIHGLLRSLSCGGREGCRRLSVWEMVPHTDDCLQGYVSQSQRRCLPRRPSPARVACRSEMTMTVTLPDGKALQLPDGATGADAAAAIGPGLARAALAVEVTDGSAGN